MGYKKSTKVDYHFIAFPSLGLEFIARDNPDNTSNTIFTYEHPEGFPDFPILKHHSHPYLVIENALPKFEKHVQHLSDLQLQLYATMLRIVQFWKKKLFSSGSSPLLSHKRHMGNPDNGPSDEEEGPSRKTRSRGNLKEKARPGGGGSKAKQAPTARNDHHIDSRQQNIIAWIAGVAAARPLEPVEENVIAPNGEIEQTPFTGDWHEWCCPWSRPPEHSKYSSNDWAMFWCMCKLTAEPGSWDSDYISDEDDFKII